MSSSSSFKYPKRVQREWMHRCETIRRKGNDFLTRVEGRKDQEPFFSLSFSWGGICGKKRCSTFSAYL